MPRTRPYRYYDTCISLCPTCLDRIDGKVLLHDDGVYMHKRCPKHGSFKVLLADDEAYYRLAREVFVKAPEMPAPCFRPPSTFFGRPFGCRLGRESDIVSL